MIEEIVRRIDEKRSKDINLLFPYWREKEEKVVMKLPHDDDGMLGSGLLICELRNLGIDVYLVIMTDGSKGYCGEELSEDIIQIRKQEAIEAYEKIGVDSEHIKRLDLPDSELYEYAFTWKTIEKLIGYSRRKRATRFLLPNENDFHLDHKATFYAGLYAAIQASEGIVPDLGEPSKRDTILRYGVWSPFKGKPTHAIKTSQDTLDRVVDGLSCFKSQKQVEELKSEKKNRGPYEYFKEFVVKPFPAENYRKMFFPTPEEIIERAKFWEEMDEGYGP